MQIAKDCVVRFHYSLAEAGGTTIESSREAEPLAVLIGHQNVIAGVEEAMLGRAAGDRFEVTVTPDKGYGERREDAIQRVPKKFFGKGVRLAPGLLTTLQTQQGPRRVVVRKVGMSVVDIDLNHPMAGKTLVFDIEIVEVRAAEADELAHGHVHGSGGVEH